MKKIPSENELNAGCFRNCPLFCRYSLCWGRWSAFAHCTFKLILRSSWKKRPPVLMGRKKCNDRKLPIFKIKIPFNCCIFNGKYCRFCCFFFICVCKDFRKGCFTYRRIFFIVLFQIVFLKFFWATLYPFQVFPRVEEDLFFEV